MQEKDTNQEISWTSETKINLKYSHFKAQFENSSHESNHYRQIARSTQELYKLLIYDKQKVISEEEKR